jgi:hypothetical protein
MECGGAYLPTFSSAMTGYPARAALRCRDRDVPDDLEVLSVVGVGGPTVGGQEDGILLVVGANMIVSIQSGMT